MESQLKTNNSKKIEYKDLEKLHDTITYPISMQLVEYNLQKSLPLWKEKFSVIKDDSWPDCNTFEEFYKLPLHIQIECTNVHNFSPEIWKKHIENDAFKPFSLETPKHVVDIMHDISSMVKNKNVIDFACNTGVYSFACYKAGAKSVLGFDVRDSNILMANTIKNYFEINDDVLKFEVADIHDYKKISLMCQDKDTVLIPGVLYHVHDHYDILNAVAKNKPKNIIIETAEYEKIMDLSDPLVWWRVEPTFENVSGWHEGNSQVPVGYPNLAWFTLTAQQLGYKFVATKRHIISHSKNNPKEYEQTRSTHVYVLADDIAD